MDIHIYMHRTGLPSTIMIKVYEFILWVTMVDKPDYTLSFNAIDHLESDGQNERLNRSLKQMTHVTGKIMKLHRIPMLTE